MKGLAPLHFYSILLLLLVPGVLLGEGQRQLVLAILSVGFDLRGVEQSFGSVPDLRFSGYLRRAGSRGGNGGVAEGVTLLVPVELLVS